MGTMSVVTGEKWGGLTPPMYTDVQKGRGADQTGNQDKNEMLSFQKYTKDE